MSDKTSSEKGLAKAKKALDRETLEALDAMPVAELEKVLVDAQIGMAVAVKERDENSNYRAAKLVISDLNGGLRDVNKRQKAKITMALHLLEAKGKI